MKLTVLGGCGAWPAAGQACSGYLVEHGGFQLLIDPGYATLPRLLEITGAARIDAVLVSHGHPDHCADLNPLLRARAMGPAGPAPLPVHTLPGALDAVLALDEPDMVRPVLDLREFTAGAEFTAGPFRVTSCPLPHFVPNAGLRLTAAGRTLAYTGDAGPSDDLVTLARGTDLLLAEATYPEQVPPRYAGRLSSATQAGQAAARAGARQLMLTHLWPGTDPAAAVTAARRSYPGEISVARPGIVAGPHPLGAGPPLSGARHVPPR